MVVHGLGFNRLGRLIALAISLLALVYVLLIMSSTNWSRLISSIQLPSYRSGCSLQESCDPSSPETHDQDSLMTEIEEEFDAQQLYENPGEFRRTTIPNGAHVHGFTVFDELYLKDGTLYIVTEEPEVFPPLKNVLSIPRKKGPGEDLSPGDEQIQIIHPERAKEIFEDQHAIRLNDVTALLYDPDQFMHHYYHWWGEIILGLWRVYSKVGERKDGTLSPLPLPSRFMIPFVENQTWRDKPDVDGPLMRAAFPGAAIETAAQWGDFAKLNTTFVFSRAIVVSRDAAHKHPYGGRWFKMIAGTMEVVVPEGFWSPLRKSMLENLLGYVPDIDESTGAVTHPPGVTSSVPVVTYVSRQGHGRRLIQEDHESLVAELMKLESEGLCQVHVAQMEKMHLKEQIALAARSTIMLGVHGNGLTHQLWMQASPKSTLIEILIPGGYVYDYEMLARNIGHRHFAVWNDTFLTYPKGTTHKGIKYPDGFHGVKIPVWGPTVAEIVRQRLMGVDFDQSQEVDK